jgi:hypothetical protein
MSSRLSKARSRKPPEPGSEAVRASRGRLSNKENDWIREKGRAGGGVSQES